MAARLSRYDPFMQSESCKHRFSNDSKTDHNRPSPPTSTYGYQRSRTNKRLSSPANASPFAYAPPAAMPPATLYAPANAGYVPLVGFGQGANAQLGRGLYGQPTAYVDGQPVRNFLRYIFP